MMKLYVDREIDDLPDILEGVQDKIVKVLETHPTTDADCRYCFLFWLEDPDYELKAVVERIKVNCNKLREGEEGFAGWDYKVLVIGDGIIVVDTWL